jgi:hypothetical protein
MSDIKSKLSEPISSQALMDIVRHYGFIECGQLLTFLGSVCGTLPDISELLYIRDKLRECLNNHDNHSVYFCELRELCSG